jgi:hypothetical protein
MQVKRNKVYENKKFRPKDISGALISIMDELGIPEDAIEISGTFRARNGGLENKEITLSDLAAIRDFEGQTSAISLAYPTDLIKGRLKDNSISFCSHEGGLLLKVCANNFPSIQSIMDKLQDQLKLIEMPEKPQSKTGLAPFEGKQGTRETTNPEISKSPSCFLSYRFNSRIKFMAPELSRFLTLLDIKVVSGPGYEQRRAAGKASGYPKSGYDFFIYLITQDDEGAWIKEELTLAHGEKVPIIILVEKGSKTGKEILGGNEYIEFDGDHIGDIFIAILEAINFMKEQKALTGYQQLSLPED